ncbi:hypothetical protein BH10BAC3_BH10BAC3_22280 [soil metagenome]
MKQITNQYGLKAFLATLMLFLLTSICMAQDNTNLKVNGESIGSWLSRYWMWVAGGVVLLLLLIGMLSGGSRKRSKTTIVREEDASGVIRTTTTEIKE